jgi:hypothetical protein
MSEQVDQMDFETVQERLLKEFGSPAGLQLFKLWWCAKAGAPCDITFRHRKPLINVRIAERFQSDVDAATSDRVFEAIPLSDGSTVALDDIWILLPMPAEGISDAQMATVDLSRGDVCAGPQGETVRQMVREIYHCENAQEEEYYLRRWIAS